MVKRTPGGIGRWRSETVLHPLSECLVQILYCQSIRKESRRKGCPLSPFQCRGKNAKRLGGLRTNFRGTYSGKWPIVGRRATLIADSYQPWDCSVAKPLGSGFEIYGAVDNLFDSIDSNLDGPDPTFFRADPGRTMRIGMRRSFGAE